MTLAAVEELLESVREVRRQRILTPLELRLEHGLMAAFATQERIFLRSFENLRPWWNEPPLREAIQPRDWDPLFTAAELRSRRLFERPLTAISAQALEAGGKAALADLNIEMAFDLKSPAAVRYLEEVPLRITGINETTRAEIRRILVNGTEQGWSFDRVATALQDKFKAFRTAVPQQAIRSRAHLIAVTEMGNAYVEGNLIVGRNLKDAGLRIEKRWLDVGDEREESLCISNAGQGWIPFELPFSSGHLAPLAHPACRCDLQQRVVH